MTPPGDCPPDKSDAELITEVLAGRTESFAGLVRRYQPRLFATARRYARRESEIEDIVQEIFGKAFQKLAGFRNEAPFEHWLMRMAVRVCYDFLRDHQRSRETLAADFTDDDAEWLDRHVKVDLADPDHAEAARALVHKALGKLSPPHRLIIQLLEIEEKSIKEISALTGWSVPLVKVRAFRARAELKKILSRIDRAKYL